MTLIQGIRDGAQRITAFRFPVSPPQENSIARVDSDGNINFLRNYTISDTGAYAVPSDASTVQRMSTKSAEATILSLPQNAAVGQYLTVRDRAPLGWLSPIRVAKPLGGALLINFQDVNFWDINLPSSKVVLEHLGSGVWDLINDGLPVNHQNVYYSKCEFTNALDFRTVLPSGAGSGAIPAGSPIRTAMQLETGTTATGLSSWGARVGNTNNANNGFFVARAPNPIRLKACFSIPVLSTATDRFLAQIGVSSTMSLTAGAQGFWLRYRDDIDSGNFNILCRDVSNSLVNTGIPVVANTWYEIAFECVPGELRSWLRSGVTEDDLVTTSSWSQLSTITVNVPFDRALGDQMLISKSAGTANRALSAGWYRLLTGVQ